jgi:hypothetical protein
MWEVFGMLYENYKGERMSRLSLSEIKWGANLYNDFYSRDMDDIKPFLNPRQGEVEHVSSFVFEQRDTEE